ncbi:uncharacterized protein LOC108906646 [Anoplophora glabripennis]|uniref:uncharacterized protein LOC108906646 n=1 Tax=Anoplophora glabripennis TaxID=217634 RepID=UPI000C76496A|nr:uncharacterized protein LOC108906646 [Anoplophora glabripennis]
MGSPLSPALANIYMEAFEKKALESTTLKPKCWYRYVDDTFTIWTMEIEKNSALPFLDVLVERKPDGTLGHRVYRKPTHTDRYLNAESHHHSAQKQGIINTLIHRARIISESRHLAEELEHLRTAVILKSGVFKKRNINTVFSTVKKVAAAFPKTCNNDQIQGPGVYSIPCSCGKVYIGQTGKHTNMRLKEHKSHFKNNNCTLYD